MSIRTIVMLGTGAVGKSAITIQYVSHFFSYFYNPTIEDSFRSTIEIDNEVYPISILDTAGQEEYSSLRDSYIRSGNGFVLVYSIIAQSTYNDLDPIHDQIVRVRDTDDVPIVVVGNKCDLESQRIVSPADGKALADRYCADFLEVSAKAEIIFLHGFIHKAVANLCLQTFNTYFFKGSEKSAVRHNGSYHRVSAKHIAGFKSACQKIHYAVAINNFSVFIHRNTAVGIAIKCKAHIKMLLLYKAANLI